jgi:hybrid cluster-associated redox disulfide protein
MEEFSVSQITKETTIGEVLRIDENLAAILMASGMHCVGCPSSQGESVEEAAFVHGMNADELVGKLNEYLATKN